MIDNKIQEIINDLNIFEDWQERYSYIIDLGNTLELDNSIIKNENRIPGCQSQVWIDHIIDDNVVQFKIYTESMIIKGLIFLLMEIVNNRNIDEIRALDFNPLLLQSNFKQALTGGRMNGLANIIRRIKSI